jgi:hypothetical protein
MTPDVAYRVVGWLGLLLTLAGGGDFLIALYPLRLGTPEWEFATVATVFAGLPLLTMGLTGLWIASLGLGIRWLLRASGGLLLFVAFILLVAWVVFLTNVPLALKATAGDARIGIVKAVIKTSWLGILMMAAYTAAGVFVLKRAGRVPEESKE